MRRIPSSVINLIETLFGVATVAAVAALGFRWTKRKRLAWRLGILAIIAFIDTALLELYVRIAA